MPQLERKSAGLQHASLDVLRALFETRMARIDVRKVLLIVITGLPAWSSGAYLICLVRAMTEGAQIINAEPWMKP